MKLDEELWATHQYQVLVSFVHHLAYYRVLKRCYNVSLAESEFWTLTIDAHLLRAIIDWCMVFGADSNEVHWKNVAVDEETQNAFRSHLLAITGLTKEQWHGYWLDMTTFRNSFAAHKTITVNYPPVPILDMAMLVATTYDDWFRNSVAAVFEEPALRARYDKLIRVSGDLFLKLVGSGPTVEDEYEGSSPPRA
jgi:hypothetical protein